MKKIILLGVLLLPLFLFSQKERKEYLKIIDSTQQAHWKKMTYDLDSLNLSSVYLVKKNTKDSLILKLNPTVTYNEDLPITPFNLNEFEFEKKWHFYGKNNLFFNQASFSNWNSGGQTNIGILTKLDYHLDYKKYYHYVENIFSFGYGWNSTKGQSSRKTEDYINIMSNYGYRLSKNFYLSAGAQLITQFSPGYDYNKNSNPEYEDRISKFLAPGYINTGIGISYNPNKNFQVIIRPINGKFTIVNDEKLQKKGKYGLENDGQRVRKELGAMINLSYRLNIYKGIYFDNKLNVFTNYINHPELVDIFYNGVLNIKFNKFITTVISLDLAYDDDQIQKLQTKQTLSIGFTYDIGKIKKDKKKKPIIISPFIK